MQCFPYINFCSKEENTVFKLLKNYMMLANPVNKMEYFF